MKKLIALTLITSSIAFSARAQWVVYDPANTVQSVINTAQEVAQMVTQINNQVRQIQQLTDQLNEFKHYEDLFGDPGRVVVATITPLINDLKKTEVGQTLATLEGAVDAGQAMLYDASGLFRSVGKEFTTPGGRKVKRQEAEYLPVAAVQKTTENYLAVLTDATVRRVGLKQQIAATTEQLKAAKSDAEVQKLTGVLIGLSAALESTDHEVSQATASAVVQDIANRADAQRQLQARKEQQHAEYTEAVEKYGTTFRLLTDPAKFPTK